MQPLVIFMVFFLSVSLFASGFDLYSHMGDYLLEMPPSQKILGVHSDNKTQSPTVGFLPRGAFILKAGSEKNNMTQIHYAYVAGTPACADINEDTTVNGNLRFAFESALQTRKLPDENKVVSELGNYPNYCYRQGTGWVESKFIKEIKNAPQKIKTEAALGGECAECKKPAIQKDPIEDQLESRNTVLTETAKITPKEAVIQTPVPKDPSCGQPNKPIKKNLGLITIGKEWTPSIETFLETRVNKNNKTYKVKRERVRWDCEIVLPEGCGKTGANIYPLDKTVAIANAYVGTSECTEVLDVYYDSCSQWKNDDFSTRFENVKELSKNVISSLKQELGDTPFKTDAPWNTFSKYKFSNEVSPELLTCIAKRESTNFEPSVVNYRACQARATDSEIAKYRQKHPLPDKFMKGWKSEAHGLSQHLWPTVHDYWQKWLKNDHPSTQPGKTFEEAYESPEKFFKVLSSDPQLQMELMARHLDYVYKLHKKLGSSNPFQKALLSYDTDQKETYLPAVNNCIQCLKKNPNDISCMGRLHPKRVKKADK